MLNIFHSALIISQLASEQFGPARWACTCRSKHREWIDAHNNLFRLYVILCMCRSCRGILMDLRIFTLFHEKTRLVSVKMKFK